MLPFPTLCQCGVEIPRHLGERWSGGLRDWIEGRASRVWRGRSRPLCSLTAPCLHPCASRCPQHSPGKLWLKEQRRWTFMCLLKPLPPFLTVEEPKGPRIGLDCKDLRICGSSCLGSWMGCLALGTCLFICAELLTLHLGGQGRGPGSMEHLGSQASLLPAHQVYHPLQTSPRMRLRTRAEN